MAGRPLYRPNEYTQVGQLGNRVDSLERRRAVSGFYEIKVFADDEVITTGDGAFIFEIPYDLDKSKLCSCNVYITTVSSSGLVTVQLENLGGAVEPVSYDMLSPRLTIDVGEKSAETAVTPAVIDKTEGDEYAWPYPNSMVRYTHQISINVDTAGTGAKGLGAMLGFDF